MKKIIIISLSVLLCAVANAQLSTKPDSTKKIMLVEASCGQCQFKLEGNGCNLAVRIEGKSYFVDGTSIDDHGDAHESDGFCEAIRKANVQGEIINGRFKASYFKVKPLVKETN